MDKTPKELAKQYCDQFSWNDPREEDALEAFIAGYQAATPQWISVKDRLPEDNLEVLFFSQEYDGCFVGYKAVEGSYVDPEGNGLSVSNIQKYYTYWTLLPELPAAYYTYWRLLPEPLAKEEL